MPDLTLRVKGDGAGGADALVERSGAGALSLAAAKNPRPTEALNAVRRWLESKPTSWVIVLRGDVGTGKTVAASVALSEAAAAGHSVAFRKSGEVLRLSAFEAGARELKMLKKVGLLVLDDVGADALTDWGRSLLVELLDARHEACARTVITANPGWPQLVERLGQRLVDRIRQGGVVVEVAGESMRGRPA